MAVLPPGFAQCLHPIQRGTDSDPYLVTYGVRVALSPMDQADVDAIDAEFRARWAASFGTIHTFQPITVRVGATGDPLVFTSTVAASTGTGAIDFAPQNCAVLIRKLSASGGRRNRGRLFMPMVIEGSVSAEGLLTSGQAAAYQTTANTWLDNIEAGAGGMNTDAMVILHESESFAPTTVTSLFVPRLIATQRRRLRR